MSRLFQGMVFLSVFLCVMTAEAQIIINEVDCSQGAVDTQEFIELYDGGTGNTSLTGYVVVLYTGVTDTSYRAEDLDGYTTDAAGYFVIGSLGMGTEIEINPGASGWLDDGAAAVAVYAADGADFPDGTAVTAANLVDAVVYDTDDPDDAGLISTLLNAGQGQVNENGNGTEATESMGRCPNGTGGAGNTSTYTWGSPSVSATNDCLSATPTPTWTPVPVTPTPTPPPTDTPTPLPTDTPTPLPTDTPT
ncbi:MAG TPA: hypothetical protein PLV45_15200, partial [bacterium]|nr:hypothetical protein [bacterium]